jgi:anti-anti-sigma factor
MADQFVCTVDEQDRVLTVRPSGELDLASSVQLRNAVYQALAEQPAAVVFDLSELTVADGTNLALFQAIAAHASTEYDATTLLCSVPEPVRLALSAILLDRRLTICATWEQADRLGRRNDRTRHVHERFPPVPDSVAEARALTLAICASWNVPVRAVEQVQVIVTELAGNAVRHARTSFELTLRCSARFVHVRVHDRSSHPARLRGPASPDAEAGRGLMLVDAFATAWGSRPTRDGKVVWATVRRQPRS